MLKGIALISCNSIAAGKNICGGHRAAETLEAELQEEVDS